MNKDRVKNYGIRLILLFVGLSIAHSGLTLFLLSHPGADPFNVPIQGIFKLDHNIGLSFLIHGITHMSVCFF